MSLPVSARASTDIVNLPVSARVGTDMGSMHVSEATAVADHSRKDAP